MVLDTFGILKKELVKAMVLVTYDKVFFNVLWF